MDVSERIKALTSPVVCRVFRYKNNDYGNGPGTAQEKTETVIVGVEPSWGIRNVSIGSNGYCDLIHEYLVQPKPCSAVLIKRVPINQYYHPPKGYFSDYYGMFIREHKENWFSVLVDGDCYPLILNTLWQDYHPHKTCFVGSK
jgi:hypothetical protein